MGTRYFRPRKGRTCATNYLYVTIAGVLPSSVTQPIIQCNLTNARDLHVNIPTCYTPRRPTNVIYRTPLCTNIPTSATQSLPRMTKPLSRIFPTPHPDTCCPYLLLEVAIPLLQQPLLSHQLLMLRYGDTIHLPFRFRHALLQHRQRLLPKRLLNRLSVRPYSRS